MQWELYYEARSSAYTDGSPHTYSFADTPCTWRYGHTSLTCVAFVVKDNPYECQFAGYGGRRYTFNEVIVVARKQAGRVIAHTTHTYRQYYCYS